MSSSKLAPVVIRKQIISQILSSKKVLSAEWLTYFDSTALPFSAGRSWNGALKLSFMPIWCSLLCVYWSKIIAPANLGGGQPSIFHKN